MRILHLSDTHNLHRQLTNLPDADIIIHSGDCSMEGTGKEIIDSILFEDSTTYIKNFCQVNFEAPDPNDASAVTRHKRRILAYKAVLQRAGFAVPSNQQPNTSKLFNKDLIEALRDSTGDNAAEYQSAARVFETVSPSWGQLANAFEALDKFIRDKNSGYQAFETDYVNRPRGSGDRWADEDLKKIIGLFQYPNGTRKIGKATEQHSADTSSDYAEDIYKHLTQGKLVIIDQSSGEPELNKSSAKRIMTKIFKENKFDIIIVDGRDRVNCVKNSIDKLKENGIIILDDSERKEYNEAKEFLFYKGYKKIEFWGIAPGVFYNKCTTVFYKEHNCFGI